MSQPVPQSSFAVGEVTTRLASRLDLDQYGQSVSQMTNFHILPQGPARKRSGTYYINSTKFQPASGTSTALLIPFVFNTTQSYAIAMGHLYLRFFTGGGQVFLSGFPYEVVSPYLASEIADISYYQVNDVMYLGHKNHPLMKLSRISETNWTLTVVNLVDGPYLDVNTKDTYLNITSTFKPAGTGVPTTAWDNDYTTSTAITLAVGWVFSYDFGASIAYAVNGYAIVFTGYLDTSSYNKSVSRQPRTWTFEGQLVGSAVWVVLDTRQQEADWIAGETRLYEFTNTNVTAYQKYRLNVTKNNGDGATGSGSSTANLELFEIQLKMQNVSSTFTFSSVINVNDGAGLTSNDVGRYVRFLGSDGFWRYILITAVSSTTAFTGTFYGLWFQNTFSTVNWKLGAFSPYTGYPAEVSIFENRLILAATSLKPRTIWMSKTGDFENFSVPDPLVETSPLTLDLLGDRLDKILWIDPGKGLFVGTSSGITSVSGEAAGVTYKNVQQVNQTNYGASQNRPIRVGPALLYQSSYQNSIRELLFNFNDDAYDAPNISFSNEHLYGTLGIPVRLETPDELILMPSLNGSAAVMCYERAQKIHGSTPYTTDGQFVSLCALPNTTKGRTDCYAIVTRTINGVQKQYVEFFSDPFEFQDIHLGCFADCSIAYSGAATTSFSGISHLEGKTVFVVGYAGGETSPKIYSTVVSGGTVTVDTPLVQAYVGLPYTATLQLLPSRSPRTDGATSYKSKQKIDYVTLGVYRTGQLKVTADNSTEYSLMEPRDVSGKMDQVPELYTGNVDVKVEGSWDGLGVVTIVSDQPMPALVRLIMPQFEKEP